jgi:hypothetical protein
MANINTEGNLNYWYEGEGTTSIGQLGEDVGEQEYWYMGGPNGYLIDSEFENNQPFAFVVMVGF